jgi:hypothetical protein
VKQLLIVSPHFPPTNAPDLHRVRMSIPYFAEHGWLPTVLTVRAEDQDLPIDRGLMATLPAGLPVTAVRPTPAAWTRPLGIRNGAIRAIANLYRAGARILRSRPIDLVYFSTTEFLTMPLGRIWKRRFGVPFVIDLQDPWFTTYYDDKPRSERPPKYGAARAVHEHLERWTMRDVDAIITVSTAYTDALRERYMWITPAMCATIPFGASERDFSCVDGGLPPSPAASPGRPIDGVYIGRGGADMSTALRVLFQAMKSGSTATRRFDDVRLSFVGTAYATGERARSTIEPVAANVGVQDRVTEQTARLAYLETLARLRAADFLVVIGSDDPQYSASKVYSYILARRPILAVVHERSPVADIIRRTRAGEVVTFSTRDDVEGPAERLRMVWARLLDRLPFTPDTDWIAFAPYTAQALAREQCRMFDAVLHPHAAPVAVPCTE